MLRKRETERKREIDSCSHKKQYHIAFRKIFGTLRDFHAELTTAGSRR